MRKIKLMFLIDQFVNLEQISMKYSPPSHAQNNSPAICRGNWWKRISSMLGASRGEVYPVAISRSNSDFSRLKNPGILVIPPTTIKLRNNSRRRSMPTFKTLILLLYGLITLNRSCLCLMLACDCLPGLASEDECYCYSVNATYKLTQLFSFVTHKF